MKVWISPNKNLVYKVENYDYKRKKIISEIVFEEYQNHFPQLIKINNIKKRINLTITVSNYIEAHIFEDLNIFNPSDIK